jgi:anti-sigma factor RsiW
MEREVTLDGLSCQQIFELLSEYLDAELPPDLCERLTAHIHSCAPCVEFVESLRQSIALCKDLPQEQAVPPLTGDAREKLKRAYEDMIAHNPPDSNVR